MKVMYRCDICGKTDESRDFIAHCEAGHELTHSEFANKLNKLLGKDIHVNMYKLSGVPTYSIKIAKCGVTFKDFNLPVHMMTESKILEIVGSVKSIDALFRGRPLTSSLSDSDFSIIEGLKVINPDKRFTLKLGVD